MVGVALAFAAGAALSTGGPQWCATLLLLLTLLRPRLPFHRPERGLALLLAVTVAGALHGAATTGEGGGDTPGAPASVAEATGTVRPRAAPLLRERLRDAVRTGIRHTFPEEYPMVEALTLAERSGLDRQVRSAFVRTGAAHLLAISGFHVGVLAGWVLLLLRGARLSRPAAAVGGALVVWGYVALLGFPTSAVRAGLLLSGAAMGRIRGRPVHSLGAWGLALLVVVLARPEAVASAGAQLSFAGALGLILWVEPWSRWLTRRFQDRLGRDGRFARAATSLAEGLAASTAAQVATLPLAVWHFQRVAVLALPATLLATPLVSVALPGALLSLLAEALGLPGAAVLASGVEAVLWATRRLMVSMGEWDPGWYLGRGTVVLACAAAAAVRLLGRGRTFRPFRSWWQVGSVAAAVLAAPWVEAAVRPPGVEIRVLDVGQGDAIAVGTPSGRWVLVDTGAGSGERLARELVASGIRRLDLLILTHPDLDHMGAAAELVRHLPVGAVADGGTIRGTGAFREMVVTARDHGIPWRVLRRGQRWLVDGVEFRVLHPDGPGRARDPNAASVVLWVRHGEFDALLTGDIPVTVEDELSPFLGPVEFLKVAHHGSRTSTSAAFLASVRPAVSVISVGRRNRFGHPAPEVVGRLQAAGPRLLRTDRNGVVLVRGRGDGGFTVRTGKAPPD